MRKFPLCSLTVPLLLFITLLCYSPQATALSTKKTSLNVLLISIDTLRSDRLSCYGSKTLKTPQIDILAERGVLFERAFAHSPTTLPAHASILLGTTPNHHGVHDNTNFIVRDEFTTLSEYLKGNGYATAAFVGAYPLDARFGLDQGFDVYNDHYGSQSARGKSFYVERRAEEVMAPALDWLKDQKGPWFLWIHCYDPHEPYEPPEPFLSRYKNPYDGEVAYVDSVLAELFGYLSSQNLYQQTIIIFTGDHGESLGDHGEATHAYLAYNSSLWIPLIFTVPESNARTVLKPVSHIDIFPTICDLLEKKPPKDLQGQSLKKTIEGKNPADETIYFEALYPYYSRGWAPIRGFIADGLKFIESPIPELYDLEKDFNELQNLAPGQKLDEYRKKLDQLIEEQTPAEILNARRNPDKQTLRRLQSLGYIGGTSPGEEKNFGPDKDVKIMLPFHSKTMEAMDYYRSGDKNRAVRMLKEIITERKDIDVAYSNLATIYKEERKLHEALLVLEEGLQHLPKNYEIFSAYLNFLVNAGGFQKLVDTFHAFQLKEKESMPELWNYLGIAYANLGEFENAQKAFQRVFSIDPEYSSAFTNLGILYYSRYARSGDKSDFQKAEETLKKALMIEPEDTKALNGLGGLYFQNKNYDMAISQWEKVLKIEPSHKNALFNLGTVYLEKGDKKKAGTHFKNYKNKYYASLSPAEKKQIDSLILKCGR
ncbi:MAG: sulfatase-like hydrolase/transferase [Candidatus Aminicenantes bacterium]|nr:sulfatase-like hydrolase/transferase [Candidatus Aminicenantes bacterium]